MVIYQLMRLNLLNKFEKIQLFGPYKVSNIVPGESVEYEAFEDSEGAKIDKIIVERVPTGIVEL